MFNPFVCGSGSFHHGDEDQDDPWSPSAPRRSKSCRNSSNKMNKNPFSTRGLDKFAMVLAELDERRQKIYEQMGLQDDHSLVRFGYSSSKGNWVPIVVKLKSQQQDPPPADHHQKLRGIKTNKPEIIRNDELKVRHHDHQQNSEARNVKEEVGNKKPLDEEQPKKKSLLMRPIRLMNFYVQLMLGRPYYYLAFVVILILLCLVIYGRSFAIICASISWYLVPTIKGRSNYLKRRSMKKKDFVKMRSTVTDGLVTSSSSSSPKAMNLRQGFPPRKHGNNKSN